MKNEAVQYIIAFVLCIFQVGTTRLILIQTTPWALGVSWPRCSLVWWETFGLERKGTWPLKRSRYCTVYVKLCYSIHVIILFDKLHGTWKYRTSNLCRFTCTCMLCELWNWSQKLTKSCWYPICFPFHLCIIAWILARLLREPWFCH